MTDKPVLRGVADALQPMLDEISKIGKSVTEFANGPGGGQALKAFAKARSAPMTDQPETHTLAEARRRFRLFLDYGCDCNHFPGDEMELVLAEYDRLRAVEKAVAALVEHYDDPAVCPDGGRAAELLDALTDALNGDTT